MPTSPSYALADLPWPAVAAHLERDRRLIVPVGACDQQGQHLPLGAGTVVAEALADDLSRDFAVLRAPTLHYGVNLPGDDEFAGAASLRPKTLHRTLIELVAGWARQGFDEFIAITASAHAPHAEAIATVRAPHARVRVVEALSMDLRPFLSGEAGPEHAGEVMTSLLLHLRSECVRIEEARDFVMEPEQARRYVGGQLKRLPVGSGGCVGQPTLATAEKGREIYEHILQKIRLKVFIAPREDEPED
jgi:creatinine amidohydrolase